MANPNYPSSSSVMKLIKAALVLLGVTPTKVYQIGRWDRYRSSFHSTGFPAFTTKRKANKFLETIEPDKEIRKLRWDVVVVEVYNV